MLEPVRDHLCCWHQDAVCVPQRTVSVRFPQVRSNDFADFGASDQDLEALYRRTQMQRARLAVYVDLSISISPNRPAKRRVTKAWHNLRDSGSVVLSLADGILKGPLGTGNTYTSWGRWPNQKERAPLVGEQI